MPKPKFTIEPKKYEGTAYVDKPFKNASGKFFTRELFFETTESDKTNVIYTLKMVPHMGYPSLYQAFMSSTFADPTEYTFATTFLGGWRHWKELKGARWFQEFYKEWKEELEVQLRAENLRAIRAQAQDPESKANFQANKFLLEKGWEAQGDQKDSPGRPSKEKIKKAAEQALEAQQTVFEDYTKLQTYDQLVNKDKMN